MRDLTPIQEAAAEGPITTPQYLIEITLDQPYYWSTFDDINWNGQTWTRGRVKLGNVAADTATLQVENKDYRHNMDALAGAYQRSEVRIWWANKPPPVPYVKPGYWAEGYTGPGPLISTPILLHEGLIYSTPRIGPWLSIESRRKPPRKFPSRKFVPPVANHAPGVGYSMSFDNGVFTIEG